MNEPQPLWRPESARAAPEPRAREAAAGGGSLDPSHPPLFLPLPPAGPRARLGPLPLAPSRTPPPPLRPTPYLGPPELRWVRVGASSGRTDKPRASAGGRGARTPLAGAGHGERSVNPHPGTAQELRTPAEEEEESGGLEGPEGGKEGGWGSEGKVQLGGEGGGRWGLMLLFFVAAAALALGAEPEGRQWRDDCRVGEQRSGARLVSQHLKCGFLLR